VMPEQIKHDLVLSEIGSLRRFLVVMFVVILIGLSLNGVRVYQNAKMAVALRKENQCLRHLIDTGKKGTCDAAQY
jgi:hypothetical protein